ncbi:hypothetical protein ACE3MS_15375 [Paenibacillus dendritiformis]|uniref:hypothetical protein n=1 Tax=Paenibacillus dendritiformis TaxID=130049 RepID=UPI003654D151
MTKCHHNIDTSTVGCYICSLEAENARLQEEVQVWQGRANANARDAVAAHEQLQHALNTLKWYADESIYEKEKTLYDENEPMDFYWEPPEVYEDGGARAKAAIQRIQEGKE